MMVLLTLSGSVPAINDASHHWCDIFFVMPMFVFLDDLKKNNFRSLTAVIIPNYPINQVIIITGKVITPLVSYTSTDDVPILQILRFTHHHVSFDIGRNSLKLLAISCLSVSPVNSRD